MMPALPPPGCGNWTRTAALLVDPEQWIWEAEMSRRRHAGTNRPFSE